MWSRVDDKKVKEREKEADIPWFMQKTDKVLRHRACVAHEGTWRPLEGGKGAVLLVERGLETWSGE